ncbi:uncharacterized protein LOC111196729 [Astyanax mexicanus]|uniref:uncharacterized protein LOC111196729 n=1 Tax=Astyanax mexicanus TaxID=7994 RepID=UPI0020CB0E5F|nr:uncharacterized protein LOC111196729 [Astyanax mexicanus]
MIFFTIHHDSFPSYLFALDPPRDVSVSNSSSGEMVNLTCSSDANPPVEIYTWFKEGRSSPVGSGHSYVPLQSGFYYCQAQNQHGAQRSAAVSVVSDILKNYNQSLILYGAVGAGGVCGLAITFITVCFCMRSRRKRQAGNVDEQIYANVVRNARPPHNDDNNDDNDDDDILDYENVPVSYTLADTFQPCRNQKLNQSFINRHLLTFSKIFLTHHSFYFSLTVQTVPAF